MCETIKRDQKQKLNKKYITENKLFCKTMKPSFTDKTLTDLKNTIAESNRVVSDCFWWFQFSHFGNILQDLGIDGLTSISLENDTATRRKTIRNIKILKLLKFRLPIPEVKWL